MNKSRYKTYKEYIEYKQKFDNKNMDELCKKNNNFVLQPQQLFLKKYFNKNINNIKQFLLYHEIGSGKTCTSIILAEEFLKINNQNKILVILPARLVNNYYDELISLCTNFKYFDENDYELYINNNTGFNIKQKLRKKFIANINLKYNILSYDKFRLLCMKNKNNILKFLNDFTKNTIVIIDEIHNIISNTYSIDDYLKIEEKGKLVKIDTLSLNSTLIKLLSKFSHNNCKIIYLTATPIYDKIKELPELVYLLNPAKDNVKKELANYNYKENLEKLKGKISYFPGTSKNAYPKSNTIIHNIKMTKIQDKMTQEVLNTKEAFYSNQRQIGISCLSKKYDIDKVTNNLKLYAPKIDKLVKIIDSNKVYGKHVIYTSFVDVGINVIEEYLLKNGWISILKIYKDETLLDKYKNKIYAIWSGNETNEKKDIIKKIMNNTDNLYGDKIKLLIGSPSIKEGVSFKHIQHIHILDPVWNESGKRQIEGRAIRFCSHYDINEKKHKNLKRKINIHIYKLVPNSDKDRNIDTTVDQNLYDKIIPNKYKEIEILLKELQKVSIDYHLFKKMYVSNTISPSSNYNSDISISKKGKAGKHKKTKIKQTCNPKIRRPDTITNECDDKYPIKKLNKHKQICCYKEKKLKYTCNPKSRRPDSKGNCKNNLFKKKNKHKEDCCYKKP